MRALTVFLIVVLAALPLWAAPADLMQASSFLGEIPKVDLPASPAPDPLPVLAWGLDKTPRYSYEVKVEMRARLGAPDNPWHEDRVALRFDIEAGDDGATNVTLSAGNQKQTLRIDGAGKTKQGESRAETAMRMLFPLPGKALAKGESYAWPLQVPFAWMGARIDTPGRIRTTLRDWVTIDGHTCARLETELEATHDADAALGNFRLVNRGRSVAYFDTVERGFVSSTLAVVLSARGERAAAGDEAAATLFADIDSFQSASRVVAAAPQR